MRGPQKMGTIALSQEKEKTHVVGEFCEPQYESTNIQQISTQLIIYALKYLFM